MTNIYIQEINKVKLTKTQIYYIIDILCLSGESDLYTLPRYQLEELKTHYKNLI